MAKTYTVNDGHTLLMPDGKTLSAGEEVKLDDALAERHADRVTLKVKAKSAVAETGATADKPATDKKV